MIQILTCDNLPLAKSSIELLILRLTGDITLTLTTEDEMEGRLVFRLLFVCLSVQT